MMADNKNLILPIGDGMATFAKVAMADQMGRAMAKQAAAEGAIMERMVGRLVKKKKSLDEVHNITKGLSQYNKENVTKFYHSAAGTSGETALVHVPKSKPTPKSKPAASTGSSSNSGMKDSKPSIGKERTTWENARRTMRRGYRKTKVYAGRNKRELGFAAGGLATGAVGASLLGD